VPAKAGRARVIFDELTFESDVRRASATGRAVARATRRAYAREGCPVKNLHACEAEAADGSRLPRCVKSYLPPPAGRFGMVFEIDRQQGRLVLAYLAFGVRHHPRDSNALTVYRIAHERLHRKSRPARR
jgi:hypothetical protein